MLTNLLVRLGLKCDCGGWRSWKRHPFSLGAVSDAEGNLVDEVVVRVRPCRRCSYAPLPETMTVKTTKARYTVTSSGSAGVRV